jgi:addiction module RelE/StbE family toxin
MLRFNYSSRFKRSYRKRPKKIMTQVIERLRLFATDPRHPLLDDHPLGGNLAGIRSFSVTGDLRVQYEYISEDFVNLIDLGTHSELYGK